jgi:hypothetical protein
VTAWAPTPEEAIAAHGPRAAGVPHPRRGDQPAFLENVINHPRFASRRRYTTRFIDTRPSCSSSRSRDRATQAAAFPRRDHRQRQPRDPKGRPCRPCRCPRACRRCPLARCRRRHGQQKLKKRSARPGFAQWMLAQKRCCSPTPRCATRTSRCWPRACAPSTCCHRAVLRARTAAAVLARMLGRRHLRRRDALPEGRPVGAAGAAARRRAEHPAADAAALAPTPSATPTMPTTWCATSCSRRPRGIDLFRVFDSLNWVATCAWRSMPCARVAPCARRDLLHRRPVRHRRAQNTTWPTTWPCARAQRPARTSSASRTWPASAGRARARCWSRRCGGNRAAGAFPHPRHQRHRGGVGAGRGRGRRATRSTARSIR